MSNSTLEGRLRQLQERIDVMGSRSNGSIRSPPALDLPRRSGRRERPALTLAEIPKSPQQSTETDNKMKEVYKMSGHLTVQGVQFKSNISDLQQLGELGSGTCGHVVKMLHKPSAAVIAVKQMRRTGNAEETNRILMDLDVVVRSHDCPYIVRCLGCFVTDADVWICMELMASCFDKLLKRLRAPIPECILGKVTVATVNALSYLKDTHGVIHRDVKPSNILLDERGNVKLCDFGISGRLVDSRAKTRSAGCAAYMAPERIDPPDPTKPDYDIRADVWSLGISLVELATGVFPYKGDTDFAVLSSVIGDAPPRLPEESDFTPEFKSFVKQCLTKNYRDRPKYNKLLEHEFVVKSARSTVSVGDWYQSLPLCSPGPDCPPAPTTPMAQMAQMAPAVEISPNSELETPSTPQPVRNFVTSQANHWVPEYVNNTPVRAWWSPCPAGGSSSQPASLEHDFSNHSPFPRRRTIEPSTSPPPTRTADTRWRPSPTNSGNTSPLLIARFQHQNQQRRSRADLHASPRHRSLSKEHSVGRSPEPPPRTSRQHHMLGHEDPRSAVGPASVLTNGSVDSEPPALLERLRPLPSSPLLLRYDRLSEGRSQSLNRGEGMNGHRAEPPPPVPARHHHDDQGWLHSLAGLVKRRISGYVKWHHVAARDQRAPAHHSHARHRWNTNESWSVPASPLPPRPPPSRPAD